MQYENISGYKFVELDDLYGLQSRLKKQCASLGLKGTILLSKEGINVMLAGDECDIVAFENFLKADERFADIWFKHSQSETDPFDRLRVRIKPEIITFCVPDLTVEPEKSHYITPEELKAWYDSGKKFIILDTRNEYEMEFGRFKGARSLKIDVFTEFPEALLSITDEEKQMPIVTYCTGGVRCEKAGPFMEKMGFKEVYQLEGGIIHYFEKCQDAHWEGECFVFDHRVAIDGHLRETGTQQCKSCHGPVRKAEGACGICG